MTKLPSHLFISTSDGKGGLFDTRKPDWHKGDPLRTPYSYTFSKISTLHQLKATIRNGAFAWPGGYPLFFITKDCAALCFDCARKEYRQVVWDYINKASTGWRIVACEINYEDENMFCDHCSKPIESAYGEPQTKGKSK